MIMLKEKFKKYLDPVKKFLFGDQITSYDKKSHYAIRPVGIIVSDLCLIPEEDWGFYAFSREPLNGKFDDEKRRDLTLKAILCGREYADKLFDEYNTTNPESLCRMFSVKVDFPDMPQNKDRVLFAEFHEPDEIHIYMDGVRKGRELLGEPGVSDAFGTNMDISKILLSHELFHFVEQKYKREIWTLNYKIDLWNLGPLHNFSGISVLGEIAAMSFTKKLMNLSYSPYVLDAFLVYGYSPEAASGLYEEMMEKAGLTARMPDQ